MKTKIVLKVSLGLLITIFFLSFVNKFIGIKELKELLLKAKLSFLLFGFFFYFLSSLLRALRWNLFFKINTFDMFLINNSHIFLNNILPMRLGELSLFYFLRKRSVSLDKIFYSFLLGRVVDLITISNLFILLFFILKKYYFLSLLMFLVFSFLGSFSIKSYKILPNISIFKKIKEALSFYGSFVLFLKLYIISIISYLLKFTGFYLFLMPIFKESFLKLCAGFIGGELSGIIPVGTFFGIGTYESSFLAFLYLVDQKIKLSLEIGIFTHLFIIGGSSFLGALSFFYLYLKDIKNH